MHGAMGFSSALKYALARFKCPDLELKDKQKEAIAISNLQKVYWITGHAQIVCTMPSSPPPPPRPG